MSPKHLENQNIELLLTKISQICEIKDIWLIFLNFKNLNKYLTKLQTNLALNPQWVKCKFKF